MPNNFNHPKQSKINNENANKDNHNLNKISNEALINRTISSSDILTSSISDINLRDISNSSSRLNLTLQPPVFPPPLPPSSVLLSAPSIPPPPVPAVFLTNGKFKTIVKPVEMSSEKSTIQIKIENSVLLEELVNKFGYDRLKIACALIISNNDINLAHEILLKSMKN